MRQLVRRPDSPPLRYSTLALGIAVNATMFSLVSAFLLRRPPGDDPERVAVVTSVSVPLFLVDANPVSAPNYLAWREANHVCQGHGRRRPTSQCQLGLAGRASGAPFSGSVSAIISTVLGVTAQLGRTLFR